MASRNRRRAPAPARPSWFFILALLLGLILLIWGASVALRKQTNFRTPPARSAAIIAAAGCLGEAGKPQTASVSFRNEGEADAPPDG